MVGRAQPGVSRAQARSRTCRDGCGEIESRAAVATARCRCGSRVPGLDRRRCSAGRREPRPGACSALGGAADACRMLQPREPAAGARRRSRSGDRAARPRLARAAAASSRQLDHRGAAAVAARRNARGRRSRGPPRAASGRQLPVDLPIQFDLQPGCTRASRSRSRCPPLVGFLVAIAPARMAARMDVAACFGVRPTGIALAGRRWALRDVLACLQVVAVCRPAPHVPARGPRPAARVHRIASGGIPSGVAMRALDVGLAGLRPGGGARVSATACSTRSAQMPGVISAAATANSLPLVDRPVQQRRVSRWSPTAWPKSRMCRRPTRCLQASSPRWRSRCVAAGSSLSSTPATRRESAIDQSSPCRAAVRRLRMRSAAGSGFSLHQPARRSRRCRRGRQVHRAVGAASPGRLHTRIHSGTTLDAGRHRAIDAARRRRSRSELRALLTRLDPSDPAPRGRHRRTDVVALPLVPYQAAAVRPSRSSD